MRIVSLLRKIAKCCISFVVSGIDYAYYVVEEFRNVTGKRNEWGDELARIEPMPSEVKHSLHTSSGKINVRMPND